MESMIPSIVKGVDGSFFINKVAYYVRPFWLTPNTPNSVMPLAAIVDDQASAPMSINTDGPFEAQSLVCQSNLFTAGGDHQFTVMISKPGYDQTLMNRPVHANTIFGTPQFPFVLPMPLFLLEEESLQIRLQNIIGNLNAIVRPVMHGTRYFRVASRSKALKELIEERELMNAVGAPFFLTTSEAISGLTIAAGDVNKPYEFLTEPDMHFEAFKMTAVALDTVAGTLTGTFDFNLFDSDTGRQLSTDPLSSVLAIGDAQQPMIFGTPWLIKPNQRIKLEVTNTTPTGNAINIYITLIGRNINAPK